MRPDFKDTKVRQNFADLCPNPAQVAKEVTQRQLDQVLGTPFKLRIGSLYAAWDERNKGVVPDERISFVDFIANRDEINSIVDWAEKEFLKMRVYHGRLCREFKEELEECKVELVRLASAKPSRKSKSKKDKSTKHEVLKEPKSEAQLTALRGLIFVFNKRCARYAKQEDLEDIKWGDDNEFSLINSIESATAWFASPHAAKFKLGPQTLRDYEVFVFDGKLATLSRSYKGGIGIDVLWTSDNEVYGAKYQPSTSYETDDHMAADPRRKYEWKGKKWVPDKKRKRA